jgi:acyl phosphate:glycerol-3-phosphate acyltransferase
VVIAVLAVAYLIGTLPVALVVARRRGIDPTAAGSGNPGATNVLRTAGRAAGALTLAGDVAKGALAAGLGWPAGGQGLAVACGAAAVLGHVAPVTRRFRGGKGVATGAGMAFACVPAAALAAAAIFVAVAAATRRASLASMAGTVAIPVAAAVGGAPAPQVAALAGCAALVVARHRDNIARLLAGTEPRIGEAGAGPAG